MIQGLVLNMSRRLGDTTYAYTTYMGKMQTTYFEKNEAWFEQDPTANSGSYSL